MKYTKGWSSKRGTATHLSVNVGDYYALCGSPVRFYDPKSMPKRIREQEICDHCQREQRRRSKKK